MTVFKEDVKELYGVYQWNVEADKAFREGWKFVTHCDRGRYDVYYELSEDNSMAGYVALHRGYRDLPSKEEEKMNIVDKTIEYLRQPGRSFPNVIFQKLSEKSFFNPGQPDEKLISILDEILASDLVCPDGEARFREYMGDTFRKPENVLGNLVLFNTQDGGNFKQIIDNINIVLEKNNYTVRVRELENENN